MSGRSAETDGQTSAPRHSALPTVPGREMAENQRPGFYLEELNKYKQKHNVTVTYLDLSDSAQPQRFSFTYQVIVDGRSFPRAGGSSKQEAKNAAAKAALESLNALSTAESCSSAPAAVSTPGPHTGNYVGQVNTLSQKKGLQVTYECEVVNSILTRFRCTCSIDREKYGSGEGPSKQAAKQEAAKMAYGRLLAEETAMRAKVSSSHSSPSSSGASSARSLSNSTTFSTSESFSRGSCSDKNLSDCCDSSSSSSLNFQTSPEVAESVTSASTSAGSCYTTDERFLKDFTDIKPIGSGGYGQVFTARHNIDETVYAVKRVAYSGDKVKREVKALANFKHPNIVLYFDCWCGLDRCIKDDQDDQSSMSNGVNATGPETKCLFIKMEFCARGTLEDWIERRRGLTPDKALALSIFEQIVEGVNYIHSRNCIHRDLKPSNIFLVNEKQIKIGDFGLITHLRVNSNLTSGRGTDKYMSPEQNSTNYGNKVDIFALGIILVELIHICDTSSETQQVVSSLKKGNPPEALLDREKTLLKKLVAQDPSDRPSAFELLLTLRSWRASPEIKKHRTT